MVKRNTGQQLSKSQSYCKLLSQCNQVILANVTFNYKNIFNGKETKD